MINKSYHKADKIIFAKLANVLIFTFHISLKKENDVENTP